MDYDVEYDSVLGCYCLHYASDIVCLGAHCLEDARVEAEYIVGNWE